MVDFSKEGARTAESPYNVLNDLLEGVHSTQGKYYSKNCQMAKDDC